MVKETGKKRVVYECSVVIKDIQEIELMKQVQEVRWRVR